MNGICICERLFDSNNIKSEGLFNAAKNVRPQQKCKRYM